MDRSIKSFRYPETIRKKPRVQVLTVVTTEIIVFLDVIIIDVSEEPSVHKNKLSVEKRRTEGWRNGNGALSEPNRRKWNSVKNIWPSRGPFFQGQRDCED